jgi:hypothetical protein
VPCGGLCSGFAVSQKNEQKQLEKDSWPRLTEPADIAITRNKPSKSRMIWLFLINLAAGDGKS